jgi:hypothetical protein
MRVGTIFGGLSLTALAVAAAFAAATPSCTPAETAGPGALDAGSVGDAGYCGSPGQPCCAPAGTFPDPKCDDGVEKMCAMSTSCSIASMCGSTSTCEPLTTSNTSTLQNFRMRRIILSAPAALANSAIQDTIVNGAVDMNEPQCGEEGTGDFNWLLSFDLTKNTLTTGGAPACDLTDNVSTVNGFPPCDPFTTGYCFVNKKIGDVQVQPATATLTQAADGTYQSAGISSLNIPIYIGVPPTTIVLPISNGVIKGVTISDSGSCIGSVNPNALDSKCSDSYMGCSKWLTAGSLGGFITLKAANTVFVSLTNETLCSLLTNDTSGPSIPGEPMGSHSCATDSSGNIVAKGDYCSTTQSAGGCQDSYWMAATFAASAVKIDTTGTSNIDCMGGASEDAGTPTDSGPADSGSAADSGSQDSGSHDASGD